MVLSQIETCCGGEWVKAFRDELKFFVISVVTVEVAILDVDKNGNIE